MPVAFTSEELAQLEKLSVNAAPPYPVSADIDVAVPVKALTTAGAPVGLLMNLATERGALKLYFNPVVAMQIVRAILASDRDLGWLDEKGEFIPQAEP